MTSQKTSPLDRDEQQTTGLTVGETTEYTVEADLELVVADGVEEIEPFRATVTAGTVEDAVGVFCHVARERLVDEGPFADVKCPPFPGYGDYRLGEK